MRHVPDHDPGCVPINHNVFPGSCLLDDMAVLQPPLQGVENAWAALFGTAIIRPLTDFCFACMLFCMRTTLNLDDRLYRAAKIRATSEGMTVTQVIQEALKEFLHRPNQTRSKYKLRWPTQKGQLLPGVNPDDRTSLYDAMDGRE